MCRGTMNLKETGKELLCVSMRSSPKYLHKISQYERLPLIQTRTQTVVTLVLVYCCHLRNCADILVVTKTTTVQYDTVGMAVSTFRTKSVSQKLDIDNEEGLSSRTTTLTPNSAQRQVQLVLKRVCLLDPNMQERKVVSNAQRMIQQRAQTAASSFGRITDISRPSTSSNVTTLSMDGKLLGDEQQPEKLSARSGIPSLEGYMSSYYRDKTTGHSFQIGDLLPAVDDHNNKITRFRRGNSTPNERSNSIPGDPSSQATQSTLLQNEDKIFMAKEGIELIRLKERQQSVSSKKKL